MRSRSLRPWSVAALGAVVVCQGLGGCGTTSGVAGLGEACSVATDCAPGLVCVVQKNGGRVCSDDLSSVLGKPPGSDDGATDETDGGGEDGAAPDDASPGVPDASHPDSGSPEEDAATPDAGEPHPDAGEPDAGQEPDAGEPEPDAGDPV